MRADNNGEGGIMALLALNLRQKDCPVEKDWQSLS
jgi:K+ transporter